MLNEECKPGVAAQSVESLYAQTAYALRAAGTADLRRARCFSGTDFFAEGHRVRQ